MIDNIKRTNNTNLNLFNTNNVSSPVESQAEKNIFGFNKTEVDPTKTHEFSYENIIKNIYNELTNKNNQNIISNIKNYLSNLEKGTATKIWDTFKTEYGLTLEEEIKKNKNIDNNGKQEILKFLEQAIAKDLEKEDDPGITTKIENPYYSGKEFKVEQNDEVIKITNSENKTVTIDLNKFTEDWDAKNKAVLKHTLTNAPAEFLFDLGIECDKIRILKDYKLRASGLFEGCTDILQIREDYLDTIHVLVHETGHSIDDHAVKRIREATFETYLPNIDTYAEEFEEFQKINGKQNLKTETYATKSMSEMFAECYALLMLGDTISKDCILKYFPKTLEAAKEHLEYCRQQPDEKRHLHRL